MSDALGGVMNLFGSAGGSAGGANPLMSLISGGAGGVGNILANITRNNVLQQQMDLTKKYANLTPAEVTSGIKGLEQPLSSGLTQGVGNVVQGEAAERGLSQSPGVFGTMLSQALGPYQLQEQQMATDAFFKQLGLPISSRPSPFGPFPQTTNTSPIWQQLAARQLGPQAPSGLNVPGYSGGIGDYAGIGTGDTGVGSLPFSNFDYSSLLSLGGAGGAGGGNTGGAF